VGGVREASTRTLPGVLIAARIVSIPAGKTTGDTLDLQPGKPLRLIGRCVAEAIG
jgi:hypothetical protein